MSTAVLSVLPDDCLRLISKFIAPATKTNLYRDLFFTNQLIISERVKAAANPYRTSLQSLLSPYSEHRHDIFHGRYYETTSAMENAMTALLRVNNITHTKLYDILSDSERMKSYGWDGVTVMNFSELRRYLEHTIRKHHARRLEQSVHNTIRSRRVRPTVCNGGCTQCGAELPLTWPSVKDADWSAKTEGYYRIGFCSSVCIKKFNDSLRYSARMWPEEGATNYCPVDERGNMMVSAKKNKYTCENTSCKQKIDWTDLEHRGGRIFCCEDCEYFQTDYEYEEDLMYRKYDNRW
jgi:hypothetical protein